MVEAGLRLLLDRVKKTYAFIRNWKKSRVVSSILFFFFAFFSFRNPKGTMDSVHLPQLSHTERPFLLASGTSGLLL